MIAENILSVTQRITRCCEKTDRSSSCVQLVCVTKSVPIDKIEEVLAAGNNAIGENRVQEAILKYKSIGDRAEWHLVGHLQTNKAKDAVKIFSLIHSLDSEHLAGWIDKEASKIGKVQKVLVQVNVSGESTKFGVAESDVIDFIKSLTVYQNIDIKGLMTIAPESDDPEDSRPYFRKLRDIMGKVNAAGVLPGKIDILSMGMSGDFEVAIEEGSTMVRVGRVIFG